MENSLCLKHEKCTEGQLLLATGSTVCSISVPVQPREVLCSCHRLPVRLSDSLQTSGQWPHSLLATHSQVMRGHRTCNYCDLPTNSFLFQSRGETNLPRVQRHRERLSREESKNFCTVTCQLILISHEEKKQSYLPHVQ